VLQDYYQSGLPMVRLSGLLHESVDLLAQLKEDTHAALVDQRHDAQTTAQQILLLDTKLARWESSLPLFFQFEACPTPEFRQPPWLKNIVTNSGSPSIMHIYDTLQTAHGWNVYRVLRIMLNKAITSVQNYDSSNHEIMPGSMVLMERLVNDICASVLSHFLVPIPGKPTATLEQEICGIRAHFLVSPLTAALTYLRSFPDRPLAKSRAEWVESVLAFIAQTFHNRGQWTN
jgi:hypothetical protein